jgi:predicted nucleotidyltransferase
MISEIDRLFGSKTRVAILTKLLLNPGKAYYVRELSRDLGITYSMLYKEKKNLSSLGIIKEEKKGKVTLLSANTKLPYFAELKGLIVKTAGLIEILRANLSGLSGVRYAAVYGSFASGEESAASDVDILIVGEVEEEDVLVSIDRAEKLIGRELNFVLWTSDEFMERIKRRHSLLRDIVEKPFIMILGAEDEFRRTVKEQDYTSNRPE